MKHGTNNLYLVYFSVIRKEDEFIALTDERKLETDVAFLHHMSRISKELNKTSLYWWWFPRDVQVVMERLFQMKPLEGDVGGLLGVIMFAGFDFTEDDYFVKMANKLYRHDSSSPLFEGVQNLAVLLFGSTIDDVSKTSKIETNMTVLTIMSFRSVFVSQTKFANVA